MERRRVQPRSKPWRAESTSPRPNPTGSSRFSYRGAQPSSARAKWNLELAERRRPPPPPQSGGGGGPPPPSGGPRSPQPKPSQPEPKDLTRSQAEQILNSMERRERQTREEQQRRMQGGASGGVKDW